MELIDVPPEKPASVGKYEVVRHLASGGMAEVFLARTSGMLGFQKQVVIKRILPHLANRADFIKMFLDEARITTQLQHPNIVQTYEVGVANRSYFIAMEYLHGETVRSIMSELTTTQQRLPIEHAVHIVAEVAAGLHYAHERVDTDGKPLSIVHRDVTPQNIIVTFDGTVKLLDFGIAKAQNRIGETRAGTLKGKLPYMSPEQCRGEEMDHRSDIFSLGIMLYELTLSCRLFRGVSDFQILKQIVEGEVTPPRQLDPEYPPALEEIVLRALRKPREDRYQSARELLVDLEAFRRTERLASSPIALADFIGALFRGKAEVEAQASLVPIGVAGTAAAAGTGLSLELEIGGDVARPQSRLSATQLEGPDIPVTPAFNLEFTGVGAPPADGGPSITERVLPLATRPAAPVPALRGLARRVAGAIALVGLGGAAVFGLRFLQTTTPRSAPTVLPVAAPAPPPPVMPVPATPTSPTVEVAAPRTEPPAHAPARHTAVRVHAAARTPAGAPARKLEGEGTLVLATTPWCEVTIDKIARGTTPLTTKLAAGSHTLVLSNSEFHVRRTVTVTIEPDQVLRKRLDFDTP